MISRHWRGLAKAQHADAYVEHLKDHTFKELQQLAGFISASILRRPVAQGVEFLIVTNWTSIDAIRAFAGDKVETAVVPQSVQGLMVEFDTTARHFEIVE